MISIRSANAELGPAPGALRGRQPGLVLGRGRRAVLHPVGRLAGDRAAGGRDRRHARRPRPARASGPPPPGTTLVTHAEAIFAQVEAAEAELAAVLGVRAGRLRVASFPSAGATLMPLAVAAFRRAHPDVALTLAEGEPEEIGPRLRAGEFDLALLFEFPGVQPRRERPGRRPAVGDAARGPDGRGPARRPSAGVHAGADARPTCATSSGCRPRPRARAPGTWSAPAWPPALSPTSPSSQTTTTPCRGWWPPGVGVALIPRLALTRVHRGIVVRALAPRSPVAPGDGGDDVGPRRGARRQRR